MPPIPPGFVLESKLQEFGKAAGEQMEKYPPESQKPGLLKQAGKIATSVGESALQLGTGLTAIVPAVGAGLYEAWKTGGRGEPWQKAEEAYGKATYQPKTKEGREITETFISMTPLKLINEVTATAASYAPDPEAAAAIRLGGGLFLSVFMGKYGHRLAKGEPVFGRDFKKVARDVPNLPEEVWQEIERIPDQAKLYQFKLEEMAKRSGRSPEEIKTWLEQEWKRQQPGEFYFADIEKVFEKIPEEMVFAKGKRGKIPKIKVTPEPTKTPMSKTVTPSREGDVQAQMTILMEKIATSKPLTEADKEFARVQGIYEEAPSAVVSPEKVGSNYDRGIVTMPKRPGVGGPEAGGLLYGMKLPKFAENINLEKVITREPTLQDAGAEAYGVKQTILELTELHQQRIRTSREAGGRTWEQEGEVAKAIADKMGIEDIAAKFGVKADKLPGFVYASKEIVVKMAEDFNRLRSEYVANPTDENLVRLKIAIEKSGQMLSDISAGTASIGRSLNIMRRIYRSQEYLKTRNYKAAMDAIGGREITEKMAQILATIDFEDPVKVVKLIREFSEATTMQKVVEAWKMNILSSPLTHARNTASNFIALMSKPAEKAVQATIEIPRSILTGRTREATYGQVGAELFGMWKGIPEGWRRMIYAFKNEVTMREASKFELGYTTAIKGKLGRNVRIPGRALIAADEFFKGILQTSDFYSQAWKRAGAELKAGKISRSGFSDRVSEILSDPPKEMVEHATGEALYRTFQKSLGKGGKGIISLKKSQPILEFIAPFVQTPINIAKFGLERTPLNLPRVIWKITHGDFKGEQASAELAKVGLGTMTSIATFIMAREGMITGGGPVDPKQRQSLYRTGWQPYSIKIGDKYLSYGGLEPFGTVLGISADFAEMTDKMTESERKKIASKIIQSVTKNLTSKTYLQGITRLSDAISDPERYGEGWVTNFARSIVPNVVGTVTDSSDPILREARDIISTIKSRIPGLSQTNLPRRDIYGKPIEKTGTWLTRLISPVKVSDATGTDVDKELVRLKIGVSLPDNKIKDRELTKTEYDELLQITGSRVETVLGNLIKSASYKNAQDDQRREDMIDYAVRKARELGRTEFMIKNLRKKQ